MALPVAIQLFSLRNEMANDVVGTLKAVKAMGYDGVEFAGLHGKTPEEMKTLLNEIGLCPVSAHVPYPELIADPEKVAKTYKAVGCKHVVIPWLDPDERPDGKNFGEFLANVKRIGEVMYANGMNLHYHNHEFEFIPFENGECSFDALYAETTPEILKMQLDCCWCNVAGKRSEDYLKKYANRCPLLHLKDYVGQKQEKMYNLIGKEQTEVETRAFEFRSVGQGKVDFDSILAVAEDCGVEWLIVEQDYPTPDKTSMECAELSRIYLKSKNF